MIGYVYLDNDRNLSVRLKSFIEEHDPGFWSRNAHMIDTVWEFDSENKEQMEKLMYSFKSLMLSAQTVQDFCAQVGFDLAAFVLSKAKPAHTFLPADKQLLE